MNRPEKTTLHLHVNNEDMQVLVNPGKTLLEVLREDLALTGTKHGCELGECGACTILLNGKPILSCMLLAESKPTRPQIREALSGNLCRCNYYNQNEDWRKAINYCLKKDGADYMQRN